MYWNRIRYIKDPDTAYPGRHDFRTGAPARSLRRAYAFRILHNSAGAFAFPGAIMTGSPCLKLMRVALLTTVMAGLVAAPAHAQPPRPTFTVTQHPDLYFNVWPADVDEDGITDLVAGTRASGGADPGDVVVALGRGDGSFRDPVAVNRRALPLTASDFNADGFIDIIVRRGASLEILGGHGNGTFDPARAIDTNGQYTDLRAWAISGDMDGDGHRDLIVPDYDGEFVLKLYPGTGTLTFGPPIVLATTASLLPADAIGGDFNGDGRRDFAVVNMCCHVNVFINQGGNTFTRSDISGVFNSGAFNDITAGDLNADGRLDLVGVSGRFDSFTSVDPAGRVVVLLGNGDGTFRPGVEYGTGVDGTTSVVVGDFNGDGKTDVVTSNRSVLQTPDFGVYLSDSVSILPGDGTGRLLAPTIYALAYIVQGDFGVGFDQSSPYWGATHQLNTSDLNGDRRTDLITSPGATLLNRVPRANRAPKVFAGPDRTVFLDESWLLFGADASDPDMDWLTYSWTDETGQDLGRQPFLFATQQPGTTRTYTVTVDDGHGGVAHDSVTIQIGDRDADPFVDFARPAPGEDIQAGVPYTVRWTASRSELLTRFVLSYSVDDGRTFAVVPGCGNLAPAARECVWSSPGPLTDRARLIIAAQGGRNVTRVSSRFAILPDPILPLGFVSGDIGAVGAAGRASFVDATWTVEGSGADIWDTADEFRYVYIPAGSQFSFTARVASIENLNRWVKAGIMFREDLSPGARHVSLFATPRTERGLAFQRRLEPDGTSEHTRGPAIAPPMWLRVGRSGDTVSAYYRLAPSQPWTLVGRQTVTALRSAVYVGLAVSSHVDGELATATFDNVAFERGNPLIRTEDVGNVSVPGSTTFDGVVYELQGSGADIWGTVDAFHFAYSFGFYSPGSIASIAVRVRSVQNTHSWAKAGVMYRELSGSGPTPLPDARHVMVVVTPGRGVAMQYRRTSGGPSAQVAVRAGAPPKFVSLSRSGSTFTGLISDDGVSWQVLGQVDLPGIFADPGLVVTSHDNSTRAVATFDDLRLTLF
jgi:hypothetical protein